MDRNKEKPEECSKPTATNLETLITTATTATTIATIETPPADDDTSTESFDTFESWTLVEDKQKSKECDELEDSKNRVELEDSENRVEILKDKNDDEAAVDHEENEKKIEQEVQLKDSLSDVTNDDFSDGISIISESESVGRMSPHPYLRDFLHDLNMRFPLSDHVDDDSILHKLREDIENEATTPPISKREQQEATTKQELRQRHRSCTAAAVLENKALQKASQTVAISGGFSPYVKRGLQGMFFLGVALAILALIGKMVHPNWQPLASVGSSSRSTAELDHKVNSMELQNNLMRAEIDLLNKQVKYLSTLNDAQQRQKQQQQQQQHHPQHKQGKYKDLKDSKSFKAWSGNGDSLKPVDITKQDLRKPFKCPDGSFVEIANMCIEQSSDQEPSLVDQFGQAFEDLKDQSEAFRTFEKAAEELQGFQHNPFEQLKEVFAEQLAEETPTKQYVKNKPVYSTPEDHKQTAKGEELPYSKPHKYQKYDDNFKANKEYRKDFGKNENNPSKEFNAKKHAHDTLRDNSIESNEWKTEQFNNNSKERKYRKERYNKDFGNSNETSKENQSKERYNRQKRKYDRKNDNDDGDSGEWQEKYMRHREQQRKQNEQKYQDNKNWYIKRGDSREYQRSGEKQIR